MKLSFASPLDYMSRQYVMLRVVLGSMVHLRVDFLPDISILLEARKVSFKIVLLLFFVPTITICTGIDCVVLWFCA